VRFRTLTHAAHAAMSAEWLATRAKLEVRSTAVIATSSLAQAALPIRRQLSCSVRARKTPWP
jgi:hypothetical protein